MEIYGVAFQDEATLMQSVAKALEQFKRDRSTAGVSTWTLPTSDRPFSLYGVTSTEELVEPHRAIRPQDESKDPGIPEVYLFHPLMWCSGNVCPA